MGYWVLDPETGRTFMKDGHLMEATGPCECPPCTEPLLYRQYRNCSSDALVDLWEVSTTNAESPGYYPKFIYYWTDNACYYIDEDHPTSISPGRTIQGEYVDYSPKLECDPCYGADCDLCQTEEDPQFTPSTVTVTITGLVGTCCAYDSVPESSSKYNFSGLTATCVQGTELSERCTWSIGVEGVGTGVGCFATEFDEEGEGTNGQDCASGNCTEVTYDAFVAVARTMTGWAVVVTIWPQGFPGDSFEIFSGECATDTCAEACTASNDISFVCDINVPGIGGGSAAIRPN